MCPQAAGPARMLTPAHHAHGAHKRRHAALTRLHFASLLYASQDELASCEPQFLVLHAQDMAQGGARDLDREAAPNLLLLQKHLRASSWALFISRTHLRVGEASPGERAGSKGTDTCGLDRAQCARPQDCTNLNFLQNFRVKFCFSTALSTIEYITNLYLIRS